MIIVEILLSIAVLYLLAGAFLGLRHSKDVEKKIESLKEEGYGDDFLRGYKYGAYKAYIINGPILYILAFLGIIR